MKTIIFRPELSPKERVKELKKACRVADYEKFNRNLTESEIEVERHAYAETGMRIEDVEFDAKESAEGYKMKLKMLKSEAEEKLSRIRTGQREVYDEVWGVPDYETGKMIFYDKYGEIVRTRNLVPDEYNGRIFDNENEPLTEEKKEIGWDGVIEDADLSEQVSEEEIIDADIEDAEIVEDENPEGKNTADDDGLPDFLKPDGDPTPDPGTDDSKPAKKPRKPRKGGKGSENEETA